MSQADMTVVGNLEERSDLLRALEADKIDAAIVGTQAPDDLSFPRQIIEISPPTAVLMLAVSGRNAAIYSPHAERISLGDVSPQALVEAIRETVLNGAVSLQPGRRPNGYDPR